MRNEMIIIIFAGLVAGGVAAIISFMEQQYIIFGTTLICILCLGRLLYKKIKG